MKSLRTLGMIATLALSVSAFAADVSGMWKGKMSMDMSAVKKEMAGRMAGMKPEQKKQMAAQMAMAENMFKTMIFELNLNKNGTYTMKNPMSPGAQGKGESGKWKLAGNTITMTDDNAKSQMKVVSGKLNGSGKVFVIDMSEVARKSAPKGSKIPAMTLTFTKG